MYKQSDMPPKQIPARLLLYHCCSENKMMWIGHANEYPTMHHFGNPGQTQSIKSIIAVTEYFWKLQLKLHFGNAVDIPFQNYTVWAVCNINIYHAWHFIYCGNSCTISLIVLLQQQWEGGQQLDTFLAVTLTYLWLIHRCLVWEEGDLDIYWHCTLVKKRGEWKDMTMSAWFSNYEFFKFPCFYWKQNIFN